MRCEKDKGERELTGIDPISGMGVRSAVGGGGGGRRPRRTLHR
jgi:hypothetical protein